MTFSQFPPPKPSPSTHLHWDLVVVLFLVGTGLWMIFTGEDRIDTLMGLMFLNAALVRGLYDR